MTECVSLATGFVMAQLTVLMVLTKKRLSVTPAHSSSSVQMEDAQILTMFVMEEINAEITAMKLKYVLVCMSCYIVSSLV